MIFEKKRKKKFLRYFLFFYVYSVFEWWVKEAPFFGRIWWNKNFTARACFFEPYCFCGQNMSKNEPVAYSPKLALKISRRIFLWIFFAPILHVVWFSCFLIKIWFFGCQLPYASWMWNSMAFHRFVRVFFVKKKCKHHLCKLQGDDFQKKKEKNFSVVFGCFWIFENLTSRVKGAPFFGQIWWNQNFTARACFFGPYCLCGQNMSKN